ncbi:lysylphosphatidylglycerol synthase transmembrane domain-containing protein [Desulfobacterales bacterium HSG16]|nr:lysylphosphatidylglycerol synthase transmembrane domain-containing protein [Desulfobacterales bacterium HSG16]
MKTVSAGKKRLKWSGILLTLLIVAILLVSVDIGKAMDMYSRISGKALCLSVVIYYLTMILRTLRFNWLLNQGTGKTISPGQLLPIVLVHQFYNRVLPFRTGEASYVVLLKTVCQYDVSSGISTLLVARIYDALTVMVIFLIGLSFFAGKYHFAESYLLAFGFILFLLLILWKLPFMVNKSRIMLSKIGNYFFRNKENGKKWVFRMNKSMKAIEKDVSLINRFRSVFWLTLSSLGIWTGLFGMFYMFMYSCRLIPMSLDAFWQVITAATLSIYTFVLPINVISGPMEASWAVGFIMVGIDKDAALASGFGINWLSHLAITVLALPSMFFIGKQTEFFGKNWSR